MAFVRRQMLDIRVKTKVVNVVRIGAHGTRLTVSQSSVGNHPSFWFMCTVCVTDSHTAVRSYMKAVMPVERVVLTQGRKPVSKRWFDL
jgi:hypothetical protein